jgi:hypothetical protein
MTFKELISEIETIFQNYAETGDIDRVSIKGWTIQSLRDFGVNICEKKETIVDVINSKALLSEDFKALILALKLEPFEQEENNNGLREVPYKTYVSNPVLWDTISQEYVVNNCESYKITENLIIGGESKQNNYNYQWLSLVKGMQKDVLDVDCYNLHPSIRNNFSHNISITNRMLNANFKTGKIYLQYKALPTCEDGEIMIPEITTGDIKEYVINEIKIKIAENLILNNKNAQGAGQLLPMWKQDKRLLYIKAKSEASWNGLSKDWDRKFYLKNRQNQQLYNLPRL